jgi:hypothetical protein
MKNRESIQTKTLIDQIYGLYQHHTDSINELIAVKDVSSGILSITRTHSSMLENELASGAIVGSTQMYVQRVTFGSNCVDRSIFHIVQLSRYWKQTGGFMVFPILRATLVDNTLVFEYDSTQNID